MTLAEKHPEYRTSALLADFLAMTADREQLTLGDILATLGQRAFGATILVLSLMALLVAHIPGISSLIGLPIILISAQICLGWKYPALPAFLRNKSFSRETVTLMVTKAQKLFAKTERFIQPRLLTLTSPAYERWVGAYVVFVAVVLALPALFGNFLPSLSLVLLSLGMIEKDGVFILIGGVVGLLGLAYVIAFYMGLAAGVIYLLQ